VTCTAVLLRKLQSSVDREVAISTKGICPPAQGCCTQLPWERDTQCPNPNGVASTSHPVMAFEVLACRNPVGVRVVVCGLPKVAEYSNLGLRVATTSWLKPLLRKAPKVVFKGLKFDYAIFSIFGRTPRSPRFEVSARLC